MKSIFDPEIRKEVIDRVDRLQPVSTPVWGKMTVSQMVRHCTRCEEYYFGNVQMKRSFLGRLIGRMAIRGLLKDDSTVLGKNAPTGTAFRVREDVQDLDAEKQKWKSALERYATYTQSSFDHWFFGKMTRDQLGQFIYKHCDHHLRQFAC
ncbi:MAG TPA: DinB family protein [Puia sp.]|nr:DinB family protein [Puia sp.]